MKRSLKWAAVAVGAAGIVAAAFVGGRAWAGGVPAAGALTYSGLLQDATGAPLTGTQYVEVKFWNDTAASAAANLLCDTGTPTGIGLVNGRFSIALPDKCTTQVGSNVGIWAEVIVGATANAAASLGRAKIGAVPFAVEANHAVSADSATGALDQRLAALESQDRVVRASVSSAGTVLAQTGTWMTVTHPGPGDYPIAFTAGTFSSTPTCVLTVISGNQAPPIGRCRSASKAGIDCLISTGDGLTGIDSVGATNGFSLVCVGPK